MAGPTISRIVLGTQLQQLRDAAGISRTTAAAAIGRSPAHIGHIETGRNAPATKGELVALARDLYGASPDVVAALEALWPDASKHGWWSIYGLPDWLARYVGLETDAAALRSLELENIHGLLQTERYMRIRYECEAVPPSNREMDKRVLARLHRQQRLVGEDPLQLIAVVSQAALERCARTRSVARGQLAQLQQRAMLPNVDLRVLPFNLGVHAGQDGPFSLLSFPDQLLEDMAYQEDATGGRLTDTPSVVAELHTLFNELRKHTLGPDESIAMIAQLAEQHTQD